MIPDVSLWQIYQPFKHTSLVLHFSASSKWVVSPSALDTWESTIVSGLWELVAASLLFFCFWFFQLPQFSLYFSCCPKYLKFPLFSYLCLPFLSFQGCVRVWLLQLQEENQYKIHFFSVWFVTGKVTALHYYFFFFFLTSITLGCSLLLLSFCCICIIAVRRKNRLFIMTFFLSVL